MTYCTHCGAPLDGAVNFCKTCGAKLAKGKSLALSAKTPGATLAERQNTPVANATPAANETATSDTSQTPPASTPSQNPTLDGRKKLAIFIGAGVAVAALILALLFTAFPNPERPLTVAQLLDLGEKYLLELDYEQALVQFMAVIEIEPINGRGYIGAAEAYIGLGDNDSAVEILWEGYEITSNAEIWRMFGEVAAEQEPAVETAPDSTTTENETEASHVRSAQVGDIIEFGGYDWRVLDVQDEKALVISEYVINNRQYHNEMGDITWADSEIRSYLNGEFYNSFQISEIERIAQTQVVNNDNPWFGTPGGDDTQDYIFLLSIDEVVRYFGDSGQLANRPNDDTFGIYDEYSQARVAYHMDNNNTALWWWLRSPGGSRCAAYVFTDGLLYVAGDGARNSCGVRPAMWITIFAESTNPLSQNSAHNVITFPDFYFEKVVREAINKPTGSITRDDVAEITYLNLGGAWNNRSDVSSLEGIEYFASLTQLECYSANLTTLDVSGNTALKALYCGDNQITVIDVSANTLLVHIVCDPNVNIIGLDESRTEVVRYW